MLSILDLFDAANPMLTADQVITKINCTRPTGYRYLRELCHAGLLSRLAGSYILGARIIEWDHHIIERDPLLQTAMAHMATLRDAYQADVLLTVYLSGKIIVLHHERAPVKVAVSYGRGTLMPLFRGAASKAILANLPPGQQRRLYDSAAQDIAAAGLGQDWLQFRKALMLLRRQSCVETRGELDSGSVGLSCPILLEAAPLASLTLVFNSSHFGNVNVVQMRHSLLMVKQQIEAALAQPAPARVMPEE